MLQTLVATISLENSGKEARLLRNDILSLNVNRPGLQTFTYCIKIKNKKKSCESQAQSPSHRFTGKSEQNIATKLHAKRTTARRPCVVRGVTHSGKKWRSALRLNAMHSDKNCSKS